MAAIGSPVFWEAYELVEGNGKAAGVDSQSHEAFAADL